VSQKLLIEFSGKKNVSKYVRVLAAGEVGAPLTEFATSFPKPVWLACNPNFNTLAQHHNLPYVSIDNDESLLDIKNLIKNNVINCDTVVIDRLDELQRKMFLKRMIQEKRDFLKSEDWNWMEAKMNQIIGAFCGLEKNVVIVCAVKDAGGFDGQDFITRPDIQGGFSNDIYSYVDYAFLITPEYSSGAAVFPANIRTRASFRYPWIFDKTKKIENFDILFDDENSPFDTISKSRHFFLQTLDDSKDAIEVEVETSDEKELLTGMSKDDKLNKLLQKNKNKKEQQDASSTSQE
jgi:hypothetical protein